MKLQGTIYNVRHPEYGKVTVQFPIPNDEYEHILGLLGALRIGDALKQDCCVQSLECGYPVLDRLEGSFVNLDELDCIVLLILKNSVNYVLQSSWKVERISWSRWKALSTTTTADLARWK